MTAATRAVTSPQVRENRRRGLPILLDWLEEQTGDTWQQRWLDSGADAAGDDWAQIPEQWLRRHGKHSPNRLELMTSSLLVIGRRRRHPPVAAVAVDRRQETQTRPQHDLTAVTARGSNGCNGCASSTRRSPCESARDVLFRSAVIVAGKGGLLSDVAAGDVLEVLDIEHDDPPAGGIRRGDHPDAA